jgi:predicted ATPase
MESGRNAPEDQLKQTIGQKQMLIVLDNCEHLIEDVAKLASSLLSACSRLKILATSRESFRIPGEWLYLVPAFDIPKESESIDLDNASDFPALMLFVERARAVRPDFKLTSDNLQTITAICSQLDGLPLVIELIAARMRLMSPQALLERMSGQFVLTADGMRPPSERQKTLRNAIDWSYNLLSEQEQKLFASLSVFSGGFTMDAAEAMFSQTFTGQPVSNLVTSLLDKSLLQRAREHDPHLEPRYTMLVTIQEFARERLHEMGEATGTSNLHLTYFCKLAEQAEPQLRGAGQLAWLGRLDAEYDNIRVALNWAQASGAISEGLRLATDLEMFWIWRAHIQEPSLALENLLAQPLPAAQIQPAVRGHRLVGMLNWNSSNKIPSETHFKESERLSMLLGPEGKADVAWARHVYQAFVQSTGAQTPAQIRQKYDQLLKVFQEAGDSWGMATMLSDMSRELEQGGDFIGSQQALEQSLRLFRECGDRISASKANVILAYLAVVHGKYTDARSQLEEILHFYRQAHLYYLIDIPLWLLGVIAVREGDNIRAKSLYTECLLFDQQMGLPRQFAECFIGFASIAIAEQNFERAVQLLSVGEANATARVNPLENIDQIELKRLTAILREEFGDAKLETLASRGRAMTVEQAIAYALEDNL